MNNIKKIALIIVGLLLGSVRCNAQDAAAGTAKKDGPVAQVPSLKVALNSVRQVSIVVEDFDRAIEFYSKTLNLRLLGKFPNHTAVVNCGDTMLFIQNPEDAGTTRTSSTVYFNVDDIVRERKKLIAHGVTFEADIHQIGGTSAHGNLWMTFFHDPDGNYLALCNVLAPEIKIVANEYTLISTAEGYKDPATTITTLAPLKPSVK